MSDLGNLYQGVSSNFSWLAVKYSISPILPIEQRSGNGYHTSGKLLSRGECEFEPRPASRPESSSVTRRQKLTQETPRFFACLYLLGSNHMVTSAPLPIIRLQELCPMSLALGRTYVRIRSCVTELLYAKELRKIFIFYLISGGKKCYNYIIERKKIE